MTLTEDVARKSLFAGLLAVAVIALEPVASFAQDSPLHSGAPFKGKIALSAKDSMPDWPQPRKAPNDAPNIVLILLDDIGFADTSTFGGVAQTPQLDRLAAEGLRYINFNNTALCSPTRAALLSGRNHHRMGFGINPEVAGGYPGYNSLWKTSTASIAQILRLNGYSTAAFGKWHNTPEWEVTPTGPFDRWPTGLGFEYFYGFMGPPGAENQWEPTRLYRDTIPIDPPQPPGRDYHFTTDITDEAIRWIRTHESLAPEKPYFLYFATGAVHAPHHAPQEWIDRYRGRFDEGWDVLRERIFKRQKALGVIPADAKLTPRPPEVRAWNTLSADEKRLCARQMEVYAGFIAYTDAEVGRLLTTVRAGSHADNTLILYLVGDNGASGLGGPDGYTTGAATVQEQLQRIDELGSRKVPYNDYATGWGWAGNTPFQGWKTLASHFGGTRDPLIVSWPARIKDKGGLRSQFTHVNDVAATLYEAAGISLPAVVDGVEQEPLDGVSFAQTFYRADVPSNHHTQYFEISGNRAIYQDGWVAAARHRPALSGTLDETSLARDRWELYHVAEDFSEAQDLAAKYPGRLKALQTAFEEQARENDVYPLGAESSPGKPSLIAGKHDFVFYPDTHRVPDALVPRFMEFSYRMTAEVIIPESGAEGIIAAYGDRTGGFVFYVKGGRLVYENRAGTQHDVITSQAPVPHGSVSLAFDFERDQANQDENSGIGRLYIDGNLSGEARLSAVKPPDLAAAMFIGYGAGSPVSQAFVQPFAFTGTLQTLRVQQKP